MPEGRQVTVISGANQQDVDLPEGDTTVSALLNRVGEFMNIPRRGNQVQVNGETVSSEYVVNPGDRVEFVRPAGEKAA